LIEHAYNTSERARHTLEALHGELAPPLFLHAKEEEGLARQTMETHAKFSSDPHGFFFFFVGFFFHAHLYGPERYNSIYRTVCNRVYHPILLTDSIARLFQASGAAI
jgi:hypothetical protein